jgi:hypothetical protein
MTNQNNDHGADRVNLLTRMSPEMRKEIRVRSALRDMSMSAYVNRAVEAAIARDEAATSAIE